MSDLKLAWAKSAGRLRPDPEAARLAQDIITAGGPREFGVFDILRNDLGSTVSVGARSLTFRLEIRKSGFDAHGDFIAHGSWKGGIQMSRGRLGTEDAWLMAGEITLQMVIILDTTRHGQLLK